MELGRRPWWMNGLFAFCLFMTFVYMPYDFLWKPVADDRKLVRFSLGWPRGD